MLTHSPKRMTAGEWYLNNFDPNIDIKDLDMNKILSIIFLLALALVSHGQVVTWTGGAGNNFWDDGDNWDTSSPPTSSDEARIEIVGEKVFVQDGYSTTIKKLYCDGDLTIYDGGILVVNNSDGDGVSGSGDLLVEGQLEITKSANSGLTMPYTIADSGILLISDSSNDGIQAHGTNDGQLQITNTTNTAVFGFITNNGELLIDGALNGVSGGLTNNGPAEIINITNAGIVERFSNTSTLDIDGGSLNLFLNFSSTNSGTLNLNNASVRSVTGPGTSYSLTNELGGIINIDDTPIAMEMHNGALINNGQINITDADEGIEIENTSLTMGSLSTLTVSTNTGSPITLDATSALDNSGSITLTSLAMVDMLTIATGGSYSSEDGSALTITGGDTAIDCKGTFTNAGVLLITGSQHGFHKGSGMNVIFENEITGDVDINDVVINSIIADIDNEGDIKIDDGNSTVAIEGHIENAGDLELIFLDNAAISGSIENSGEILTRWCNALAISLSEGANVNSGLLWH